jgi:hypothetical protein
VTDVESDPAVQTFNQLLKERFDKGFAAGEASGIMKGRRLGAEEALAMLPERLKVFMAQLLAELGSEPVFEPEPNAVRTLMPETSIDALQLPERTHLALRRNDIHTIGATTRIKSSDVQHLRNLGPKGLQALDAALQGLGYSRERPVPLIKPNTLRDTDDSMPELRYSLKRAGLNREVRKALETVGTKTLADIMDYESVNLIGVFRGDVPERLRLLDERLAYFGLLRRRDTELEAEHGYIVQIEE